MTFGLHEARVFPFGALLILSLAGHEGCTRESTQKVGGAAPVNGSSSAAPALVRSSAPTPGRVEPVAGQGLPSRPSYHLFQPQRDRSFEALAADLGPERSAVILKLNRVDAEHARRGNTLVVPDVIAGEISFAPFPSEVESLREAPQFLIVSRRIQAFGAYEAGTLVRWGPTSTGKRGTETPTGLFFTNWKAKETISTDDEAWVLKWYFNFHNRRGISFHQYALPGYPASHACVRLLEEDAGWLYLWARQWILSTDGRAILAYGTPVLIMEDYAHGEEPPWKRLPVDPAATDVTLAVIESALGAHLPTIVERQRARDVLIARSASGPQ